MRRRVAAPRRDGARRHRGEAPRRVAGPADDGLAAARRGSGCRVARWWPAALLAAVLAGPAVVPAPSGAQGGPQVFSEPLVWERLLRREGLDVRSQEEPFASGGLREGSVVVTLDGRLAPDERDAIVGFVRGGGRVLAAGTTAVPIAEALGLRPRVLPSGPTWRRVRAAPETRATARLDVSSEPRAWRLPPAPGARRLYADEEGRTGAVGVRAGRGVAVLVATSAFLGDRDLLLADNAAFARASLGPRRALVVQTASAVDGPGEGATGGDQDGGGGGDGDGGGGGEEAGGGAAPEEDGGSLPLALLLGLLTAAALVWSGRRLGPPDPPPVDADPARGVYAEAVGTALAETGDAAGAVAGAREAARRALLGGVHGGSFGDDAGRDEADPATVRAAALRAGLPADEADAVAGAPGHDPLAVGRALARLQGAA